MHFGSDRGKLNLVNLLEGSIFMNCKHCGKELKENATVCPACGEAVERAASVEETAPAKEKKQKKRLQTRSLFNYNLKIYKCQFYLKLIKLLSLENCCDIIIEVINYTKKDV